MKKRIFLTLVTLAIGVITLSCVSPFYGTARIEPGWHANAGLAATSFVSPHDDWNYCVGLRGDCDVGYGFNRYILVGGRAGGGLGYSIPGGQEPPTSWSGPFPLLGGALAVQGSYPFKSVTPSLRVEVGSSISAMPLVGFGNPEWLTVGARVWTSYEIADIIPDFFVTVHPGPRWSIFGGINLISLFLPSEWGEYPVATIGVGYKIVK